MALKRDQMKTAQQRVEYRATQLAHDWESQIDSHLASTSFDEGDIITFTVTVPNNHDDATVKSVVNALDTMYTDGDWSISFDHFIPFKGLQEITVSLR